MGRVAGNNLTVGLLGPVELRVDDALIAVSQPGLRMLLAVLALSANRVVSAEALIDALWDEPPSREREKNLHGRVYQLRRLLESAEPGHRDRPRLATIAPGYRLELADGELDLARFKRLAADGRDLASAGTQAAAAEVFTAARDLWRGAPLADVAELTPCLEAHAATLTELRLTVTEDWAGAVLAGERPWPAEFCAELGALVARHPQRERLRGLHMLALYRSGRQAEALDSYLVGRRFLAEELGLDPAPELRRLHEQMLRGDPELLGDRQAASPSISGERGEREEHGEADHVPVPRQLPAAARFFAGRHRELKELDELVDRAAAADGAAVITAVNGTGGIGKTALALHWAHQAAGAGRFPDGQLYANLRGYDTGAAPLAPAEVISDFLAALGVPADRAPAAGDARAALYRSLLADRRMLIMLDNARDSAQLRPLVPASPDCLVLVTSRDRLTGLAASHGAYTLSLDALGSEEAHQLLTARLGAERVAAEPEATAALVNGCAGLPLALSIIAARAAATPGLPLRSLAAELTAERGRLDALDTGEDATSLRAVLSWSYQLLSAPAQRLFRLLAVHPAREITVAAAASLLAVDPALARRQLAELAAASVLGEHVPGRYTLHDLVRAYVAELADGDPADGDPAGARVADHYMHTAYAAALTAKRYYQQLPAPPPLDSQTTGVTVEQFTDWEDAIAWFRAEHQVVFQLMADEADQLEELWAVLTGAVSAAGDDLLSRMFQVFLAAAEIVSGQVDRGIARVDPLLAEFAAAADPLALSCAHACVGFALLERDLPGPALDHVRQACAISDQLGDYFHAAYLMTRVGDCHLALGEPGLARRAYLQALDFDAIPFPERELHEARSRGVPQSTEIRARLAQLPAN